MQALDKHLSPQQLRVAELLAAGCTTSQVATATGFSVSYISQLKEMEEVKKAVGDKAGARLERNVKMQDRYDKLENTILTGIKERVATADMSELSRALDVVAKNNPKRGKGNRGVSNPDGTGGTSTSVTVTLPAHTCAKLDIRTNARNEVIEVDGQEMLPLTAQAIRDRIDS